MKWTSETCAANGIDVHFRRTGGGKPPIVLLHGLMGSGACWTPVARALEGEHDVILPDARGHGESSRADERGYRYEDLAADVESFVAASGLDAPVLLGHSMGGLTAALVASRRSVRLRSLVLVDPTFLSPDRQREVHASDVAEQHRLALARPKSELLADLRARHAHRPPELLEILADARFETDPRAFDILTPSNPDYRSLIASIAIPTLLVRGGDAAVVTAEMADDLAARNGHLQVQQIADAGHGIPYDRPEALASVVRAFLRALPA